MPKSIPKPFEDLLRSTIRAIYPRERATLVDLNRMRRGAKNWAFRRNVYWCRTASQHREQTMFGGCCPLFPGLEMAFYGQRYPTYDKRFVPHVRVVAVDGKYAIVRGLNWRDEQGPLLGLIAITDLLQHATPAFYEVRDPNSSDAILRAYGCGDHKKAKRLSDSAKTWERERAAWLRYTEEV